VLYSFENYTLDTDRRELRREDHLIGLEPQVFDLLEYLVRNRGRVVSRDDLIASIWGGRIVSESALSTRINAARTAIGDSGQEQRLIRTLPRKGVRFIGLVREGREFVAAIATAPAVFDSQTTTTPRDKAARAERRQLTVASCELLLGAGGGRIDPEDLHDIIQDYYGCVRETARRHDGLATHTHGNTASLHFGYPQAHEDDAERAVRAGLELIGAVSSLKSPVPLQTRVGIATGLVMVGDLIGSGETQEPEIVGETPNLAVRLQGIADPNTVVIAESTRRLLGNLFEFQDLGVQDLKGVAEPVRASAALRPSSVESRFEALHGTALTDLVGREEELELLLRRWSRVKNGEGQIALLSGEAGIGKSRLTVALTEKLATETLTCLRYFCSPQHTDSALHPIVDQIERTAGLTRDDTPQLKLDKLDSLLALTATPDEDATLFAEMLSLTNDGRYPILELTPQQQRRRTMDALNRQIQTLARQTPLLLIFEDAHWSDPTSLEVLSRVVDWIRGIRALLIVTFRPEFAPPWIGRPHVTTLIINRLAEREINRMIDDIVTSKLIPPGIRQDIIERSDGIPLFVEEMTKAVLESEVEAEAPWIATAVPPASVGVPASLHASLMARLDRLGSAKEVAQIGAAIGRQFSHAVLAAVVETPEAELRSALDRLVAAGLLFREGVPPQATYLFKHALVQDAAYGTLLREPRRALHARIAEALESHFPEVAESQPELLARHCTEAGLIEKASHLWGKAGQRSLERSALVEAVEHITRALAQIETLPSTPALRREQISLQVALITPLIHVKGYAAPETIAAAERSCLLIEQAQALGEYPADPLLLFSALYALWTANIVAFNGDVMRNLGAQFLGLAEKQTITAPLLIAHRVMGIALLCTGDIAEGRAHLDRAIALYDPVEHRPLATRFGVDAQVSILSYRALALWTLGYPKAALTDTEYAIKIAREIGHAATLMYALGHAPLTCFHCGNYEMGTAIVAELTAVANEKDASVWKASAMINRGWLLGATGKVSEAIHLLTSGISAYRSTGARIFVPLQLSNLARAYAKLDQIDDARRTIDEAMTVIEATKEKWFEAEVFRAAGDIALMMPKRDVAEAEAYLERALAVARTQQAKSFELRAAMSMARLWRAQDKQKEARDLLASVYSWFGEGFDTVDLREANALLRDLRASAGD
jgi:DNA-binding winged helix-turn-helix (wHTH) protein/predicted ATPase